MKKYFSSKDARNLISTYDFALFPTHGIDEKGSCTCGNRNCTNPGKHPATPNGFKDATKDIEKLKELWGGRKFLNVGIATGAASGAFVIDIDSEEGDNNLKKLCQIPKTLTVKTAKGRHLFFKHPGHDIVTKRGVLTGVDIRGDGGYVVGPLSNHSSGQVYDFINPLEEISAAPAEILELSNKKTKDAPLLVQKPALIKTGWTIEDARSHLSHINPDIGYDDWIAVGMALQSEGFGFHLWDEWSRTGAKYQQDNMIAHWRSFRPGAGVSYGTVVHMAKEGGWGRQDNFRPQHNPAVAQAPQAEKIDPVTGEIKTGMLLTDWIASTRYKGEAPKIEWLIEGVLQKGIPALFAAMGGLGKSFTVLDMCIEIASPPRIGTRRVLGGDIVDHGTCVFITAEDSAASVHRRINAVASPEALEKTKQNLIVVPMPDAGGPQPLVKESNDSIIMTDFFYNLRDQLVSIKNLKLVVFDPLQAFVIADITSRPEHAQFMWTALAHIASETGATILCTHHMRKDGTKTIADLSDAREAIRGTTGLVDGCRLVYAMWQAGDNTGRAIAKHFEMSYEPQNFVQGGVVKANDQENRQISTFVRQENGVLKDMGALDIKTSRTVPVHKLNAIQTFLYESLIEAIYQYGHMRIVYEESPAINSVTYDELRDVMEERGYKNVLVSLKKTSSEQVKSATQTARMGLKKYGKIDFDGQYIWIKQELENVEQKGNGMTV